LLDRTWFYLLSEAGPRIGEFGKSPGHERPG